MDAIGDVPDGHFGGRPAGEQPLEQPAAHGAMQAADSVHSAASANGVNARALGDA